MVNGEFEFGFAVDWMRKDLGITLDEAQKNGATLELTEIVDRYYEGGAETGRQPLGYIEPDCETRALIY